MALRSSPWLPFVVERSDRSGYTVDVRVSVPEKDIREKTHRPFGWNKAHTSDRSSDVDCVPSSSRAACHPRSRAPSFVWSPKITCAHSTMQPLPLSRTYSILNSHQSQRRTIVSSHQTRRHAQCGGRFSSSARGLFILTAYGRKPQQRQRSCIRRTAATDSPPGGRRRRCGTPGIRRCSAGQPRADRKVRRK